MNWNAWGASWGIAWAISWGDSEPPPVSGGDNLLLLGVG